MKKTHLDLVRRSWEQSSGLLCLLVVLLCYSCKEDSDSSDFDPNLPVKVTEILPDTGTVALPLVINGSNFGTDKSKIKVYFGDKEAVIITAKNDHLYVLNPRQAGGMHTVKVSVDGKQEGVLSKQFKYIVSSSVTTVAGTGEEGKTDGPALEAKFGEPEYLSVDDRGNIIVTDYGSQLIRLISLNDNKVTTLLNTDYNYGSCFSNDYSYVYTALYKSRQLGNEFYRDGNWGIGVLMNDGSYTDYPCDLEVDENDNLFIIGSESGTLGKRDHLTHKIEVLGHLPSFLDMDEDYNQFYMAYNRLDKRLYISARLAHVIFRVDPLKPNLQEEDFEIYAGVLDQSGFNNGEREIATFNSPRGMDFDSEGNMYVADYKNYCVRKITPDGIVSTYAGGTLGHKDGVIEEAMFYGPADVSVSPEGFVYVADLPNNRIRCIAVQ